MKTKDTIKIVLLNLLFMFGIVLALQVSQKNVADIYMEYVVSAKQEQNMLFFSNFLYGELLSGLYSVLPQVSWYGVVQYVCMLVSFFVITYKVAERFEGNAGMVINLLMLATFGYECYYNPEYTKTALVVVVAAFLVILQNREKKSVWNYVFGSVWAILGALINLRVFFIVLVLFFACVGIWMLVERKQGIIGICIHVLLLTGLVCAMQAVDEQQYEQFHAVYGADRNAVVTLYEFGFPEYAQHSSEYEALNITENMYDSLVEGRFVAINWEQMRNLAAVKLAHPYGKSNVLQKENVIQMITTSANYALLVVLGIFLFSDTKKKFLKMTWALLLFAVSIFVVYYLGLENSKWIFYVLAFTLGVSLLFQAERLAYEKLRYHLFPILGLILYFFFLNNPISHMGMAKWKNSKESWMEQRGANVEAQYIYDLKSFVESKPVFTSYADLEIADNVYMVGYLDYLNSPDTETAFSLSVIRQYGANSYWCEDEQNIYAVSNTVKLTEGHNVGFVEMSRAEHVIIYGMTAE